LGDEDDDGMEGLREIWEEGKSGKKRREGSVEKAEAE